MKNEVTLVRESYHLILKDFGPMDNLENDQAKMSFDWLEDWLTKRVNFLLDNDFNQLLNALYRIDISEENVKALLNPSVDGQIAQNIAKAIIEREKQKIITRSQFRERQ